MLVIKPALVNNMAVKIYSTNQCGYCVRVKEWFKARDIEYNEIILDNQEAIAQYRVDCPGMSTVPQIFIENELIGGHSELMEKQEYVLGILKS